MHPIFLKIGNFEIHWYGVMAAIAVMIAYWVMIKNRRHADLTKDQCGNFIFYCAMIGGVIGARIFYVVLNWEQFAGQSIFELFRIDKGGLVYYGGLFLAISLIVLYSRKIKKSIVLVFDTMAPALAIGHGISRIGCFLQGCCHGAPTDSCLGIKYPLSSNIYPDQAVMPVQLFESAGNIIFGVILLYMLRKCRNGVTFSTYIVGYGTMRFLLELLRGDAERGNFHGLSPAQIIGLLLVPCGLIMLIFFLKGEQKSTVENDSKEQINE